VGRSRLSVGKDFSWVKRRIDTHLVVRIVLAAVHAALGFALNAVFPLSLFLGTRVYLGSFFGFMALIYQGPVAGALVIAASACGAAVLGDFGFCAVSILEAAVAVLYYHRGERNAALVDTGFWVFGLWLIVGARLMEGYPLSEALLSGAMIAVFAVVSATAASLLSDFARRLPANAKLTTLLGHQRNIPFRRVVFETSAVLAMVPFLLFIVMTSMTRIKGLEREVGTRLQSLTDVYTRIIPLWEEVKNARLDVIAHEATAGRRDAMLQEMFESMKTSGRDIVSIGVLDREGRVIASAFDAAARPQDRPGSDLSGSSAVVHARSTGGRSLSLESDSEGRLLILFAAPIADDPARRCAFAVFTTATMVELLDGITLPVKSRGWIIDSEGRIAASCSADIPPEGGARDFREAIEVQRGARPVLMAAARRVTCASFSQYVDGGFSPGWKAAFVVDMSPLAEPVIVFALALSLFAFVAVAVIVLASAYASKILVSSLEQLGLATRGFIERFIDRESAPLVADAGIETQWPNEGIEEVIVLSRAFQEAGELLDRRYRETLAALEAAERANRAKHDLLSAVSHDIRGPMTGIVGVAERLETALGDENAASDARLIKETGMRLSAFVEELLDRSALDDGRIELRSENFDLRGLFDSVLGVFGASARKKGIKLVFEYDERLPARVVGDRARLFQILGNLVGNAVKYTEEGSVKFTASLKAEEEGRSFIRFDVEDTGPGISSDELAKIFDPYYRVSGSRTSVEQGLGLGLPLARGLARLMGSDIEVQSRFGEGSRFGFVVALEAPSRSPVRSSAGEPELAAVRVLLVDDEEISRNHTRRILELGGCTVVEAGDGQTAVDAALGSEFDVIFMDIALPKLDGRRAARAILDGCAALGRPRPLLFALTGYAAPGDKEGILASGFDGYLTKTGGAEAVLDAARQAAGRRKKGRHWTAPLAKNNQADSTPPVDAILDIEGLLEAYKGNREFLETLLSAFVADGSRRLEELRRCLADSEDERLGQVLHSLVNIFGSARAQTALKLLRSWEAGLREGRSIAPDLPEAAITAAQTAIETAGAYLESFTG